MPRFPDATEAALAAAAAVEDDILYTKRDVESCFVLDSNGREVFRRDGTASSITLTAAELATFAADGTLVLTHNHPRGTSFSPSDIVVAVLGNLAELRTVGQDQAGTRWLYRLPRRHNGWPAPERISQVYNAAYARAERTVQRMIRRGLIDRDSSSALLMHDVWADAAARLGLGYRRIQR